MSEPSFTQPPDNVEKIHLSDNIMQRKQITELSALHSIEQNKKIDDDEKRLPESNIEKVGGSLENNQTAGDENTLPKNVVQVEKETDANKIKTSGTEPTTSSHYQSQPSIKTNHKKSDEKNIMLDGDGFRCGENQTQKQKTGVISESGHLRTVTSDLFLSDDAIELFNHGHTLFLAWQKPQTITVTNKERADDCKQRANVGPKRNSKFDQINREASNSRKRKLTKESESSEENKTVVENGNLGTGPKDPSDTNSVREFCIARAKAITSTDDPAEAYFRLQREYVDMLNKLLNRYERYEETMKLDPQDAKEHWSSESMTREEHDRRFTKWDAAIVRALKLQSETEVDLYENNGFALRLGSKKNYCSGRALKIERITNEKLELTNTDFCYQQFSMLDVAEKKNGSNLDADDSPFLLRARKQLGPFKKKFLGHHIIDINKVLKALGIQRPVEAEVYRIINNENYCLPKGKLFCRLILNLCEIYAYSVSQSSWELRADDACSKKQLLKGIPFNEDGNPFQ